MKQYYEYYYNLSIAYFVSDAPSMFMDKNEYVLKTPTVAEGDDIMVSMEDLAKVYGPYMEYSVDGKKLHVELKDEAADFTIGNKTYTVGGKKKTLPVAIKQVGDDIMVPVAAFMSGAFDKYTASTKGQEIKAFLFNFPAGKFVIAVCDKYEYREVPGQYIVEAYPREKFEFDPEVLSWIFRVQGGKNFGELLRSFWFEKANKIQTYSIYVPVNYDPAVPTKCVVALHGGGLGEQAIYGLSQNKVQFYAERFNYIFIAPNACTKNSSYGNIKENAGFGVTGVERDWSCPENPFHKSEEEIARVKLGEYAVIETIEDACKHYNIDRNHIYLQGNSMGGGGTFYLGSTYTDLFRAIAPFGAGLSQETAIACYPGLKHKPIRMVGGTEDPGFPKIKACYDLMKANGYDIELAIVGGGVHFDSWAWVLEETFRFYEDHA